MEGGRRSGPKRITALAGFLEEHQEALEADLLAHYGIDLLGLWRGELSYRRLWLLIQHLPPESVTYTAIRDSLTDEELAAEAADNDDKYGRWSHTDLLMAEAIDAIRQVQWTLVALKADRTPDMPQPTPRPGVRRRRTTRSVLPTGRVLDYFEAMRAEHRRVVEEAEHGQR